MERLNPHLNLINNLSTNNFLPFFFLKVRFFFPNKLIHTKLSIYNFSFLSFSKKKKNTKRSKSQFLGVNCKNTILQRHPD